MFRYIFISTDMDRVQFLKIMEHIGEAVRNTGWEGHVFAVGGSVRDFHMGNPIKDIDIAVDLPDGGVEFARWCHCRKLCSEPVIYERYGTAMLRFGMFPDVEIECVMTRSGMCPVTVSVPIEEDAMRRDLTINALYYNVSTKETLDPVHGLDDIGHHRLRTPGDNPDLVFDDDPLRILRVVRFMSVLGWEIDGKTLDSMKSHSDRLETITGERIRDEFVKILMSGNPVSGIRVLHETGALKHIVPELDRCFGLRQNGYHFGDVAEHTLCVLGQHRMKFRPDPAERLACLFHDVGKTVTMSEKDGKIHFYNHEIVGAEMCGDILGRLKFDSETIRNVKWLVKNHMRTKRSGDFCVKMSEKSLNRFLYECGTFERFESLMRVIECDNLSHASDHVIYGQKDGLIHRMQLGGNFVMFGYELPISGDDMMAVLNLGPGHEIGLLKTRLMNHAFADPWITVERCRKLLPGMLKQIRNGKG